ncbi:MAG: HAMP domain-containing protein [Candidatus Omnitrophica bacterium]|nr:HAMP domain-containing protein [Candidatus Omnitrophota bacterium]
MKEHNIEMSVPVQLPMPTAKRTQARLLRAWLIGLTIFGYGPAFTYGHLAWLFNENQWRMTYLLYFTEVPLVGGFCALLLPWLWYRPIHRALTAWAGGVAVERARCSAVYELALFLPWRISLACFAAAFFGYLIGIVILHLTTNQPWVEIAKTLPAIPLVGGMMGAFCYYATARALHPVLAWCSSQLRTTRPVHLHSLAEKFLVTTCVLAIATLCLVQPAAYTLGQVVTERHLQERSQARLEALAHRLSLLEREGDPTPLLPEAAIGRRGYVLLIDSSGRIASPHPRHYTDIGQEGFFQFWAQLRKQEGAWVDRVGRHRVIAARQLSERPERWLIAVTDPADFALPLSHFMQFSWIVILEVMFVVFLFGRYFTRGITTPLGELTRAAQRIADYNDFSSHVPVTTNDELGEVARAFNRMVEQLHLSQESLEEHAKRLERSTQELSALNTEMEDLLRVVSHDLRAPLINIQGFSQRLEPLMQQTIRTLGQLAAAHRDNGLADDLQALKASVEGRFAESLRFISKGVEKMDALLSSLLAVSRVGRKADPLQPNHLDDILTDVLATFDHQLKERAIEIIRHPLPSDVPCRRNEINQVFSNLISNAINFMGPAERRFIEVGGSAFPDRVECYVRDTGIGINPEDQERVFQMFTRLEAIDTPGEGVGLAYVKKILRSHGGQIWVISQRGQGSTFIFTLPLQPYQVMTARG